LLAERAAQILLGSKYVVAFTGAGISAESGIPTFRGASGLWKDFRPEDYATPQAFAKDPTKVWNWYKWRMTLIKQATPNQAHLGLAELEKLGLIKAVLTQNVDDLHERAGSRKIIKLHGDIWSVKCVHCSFKDKLTDPPSNLPPICPSCGGLLRPDVVWFGEAVDPEVWRSALKEVHQCDAMLIVGTSGVVMPAASLPLEARWRGAKLIEVNVARSALTSEVDVFIEAPASIGVANIVEAVSVKLFRSHV